MTLSRVRDRVHSRRLTAGSPATLDDEHRHSSESAAEHLARRVPIARDDETVRVALAALPGAVYDSADTLFVVDAAARFQGLVRLPDLLAAAPDRVLRDVMDAAAPCVLPTADQERVALLAIQHGISSVPVVDTRGELLGAVPAAALLDILRREHVEDIQRFAGIQRETGRARAALESAPARRARDRLPWLIVGLAGSIATAFIVSRFERLLATRIAVTFFVPAIVYLADAIGTQTEAIVVRGLSVSHVSLRRLLAGELGTGLLVGVVLAVLAILAVALGFGDVRLAIAVAMAILVAGGLATTIGLLLPWMLSCAGVDPAFGSGPLATIIQDVLSLLVYFTIVSLVMRCGARWPMLHQRLQSGSSGRDRRRRYHGHRSGPGGLDAEPRGLLRQIGSAGESLRDAETEEHVTRADARAVEPGAPHLRCPPGYVVCLT